VRVIPHPCGRGLKDNYLRSEACQTIGNDSASMPRTSIIRGVHSDFILARSP
jgi:hypothetical protein